MILFSWQSDNVDMRVTTNIQEDPISGKNQLYTKMHRGHPYKEHNYTNDANQAQKWKFLFIQHDASIPKSFKY